MTHGSWPYLPAQCPRCAYFDQMDAPYLDDSGYEVLGFCLHPRIGMELFQPRTRSASEHERCKLFIPGPGDRAMGQSAP